MNLTVRIVVSAVLFFFVFQSGIRLSKSGRPLKVGLSTQHKLIGLAVGVLLLVTLYQRHQQVPLSMPEWIAVAVTGLCFLGTAATGGFLSTDEPATLLMTRLHQILPVLTVMASAVTLYLLLGI